MAMSPSKFLEHARPIAGRNQFIVGTFERGITFYRQQVRALNLVHAMTAPKPGKSSAPFKPGLKVAVIGGGAFGLTAAAAGVWVGLDIHLFEKSQVLIPVQRGCDTRWLHPHYYDWPKAGSDDPQAHLAILDWRAGTAGQVADQMERVFDYHSKRAKRAPGRLDITLGAAQLEIRVPQGRRKSPFVIVCRRNDGEQYIGQFHAIIYAVGFGMEHGEDLSFGRGVPYWRNDHLSQIDMRHPTRKAPYLISGTGDGGFTDLFRLTISNFRHERIFHELFGDMHHDLLASLQKVQAKARSATEARDVGWLYDQFDRIENESTTSEHFSSVMAPLKTRIRHDTEVRLNGRAQDLRACLSLQKTAFKNALLCYMLFRQGAFKYINAALVPGAAQGLPPVLKGKSGSENLGADDTIVVRHGTNREEPLTEDLGFTAAAIKTLRKRASRSIDTGEPIYPLDWWSEIQRGRKRDWTAAPLELLPPTVVVLATMFVTTLSDILQDAVMMRDNKKLPKKSQFRLTLHRLIHFDGKEHFQQITPYGGQPAKSGGQGRIFPVGRGIIGLACRTGKPIVVKKQNDKQWERVWNLSQFYDLKARPIRPYVDAILACPFFAPASSSVGSAEDRVLLVLFADSSDPNFFDTEVLHTIYAASKGFVANLEAMRKSGRITEISSEYSGFAVQSDQVIKKLVTKLEGLNVEFDNAEFKQYKDDLTFKKLRSLNVDFSASQLVEE